jgi:large subunit ribosomal protein L9
MARRKEVLLVQDVLKLGNMGDVVRVSPGYARNYLFPYGMAIAADGAAKRQIDVLREKAAKSEVEREGKAKIQAKTMQGVSIQIAARVSHGNELFG